MDPDRHVDLLTSPDLSVAWISVTKCASAFIRQTLYDNNWFEPSPEICEAIRQSEDIPKLIVLRDPIQRWISGFSQCFWDNPDIIKLTTGGIIIDIDIIKNCVQIRVKNKLNRIFQIKVDEVMIFQKISPQERVILGVLDYLEK